ncbi:MAG: A24 family peptidase C-terminal domain-containing protein [Thermoplasmata archaeon]|jgi:preflagellin peptidase FlaK
MDLRPPVFLSLLPLLVGVLLLSIASWADWRTRRVGDAPWGLMAGVGLALLAGELVLATRDPLPFLVLVPPALLFLDVLWERGGGRFVYGTTLLFYGLSGLAVLFLILGFSGQGPTEQALIIRGLGILTVILLGYVFYYLGLLKGGADAKAFMAIGILVPGYPALGPFPLLAVGPPLLAPFELLFPFAMTTLLWGALLLIGLPLAFLGRNLARGDRRWPQLLLGYKAPVDQLPRFAWTLQEVKDGRMRHRVVPRTTAREADLEALRAAGVSRVWVTPQIPFLIPLTVGFLLAFLVGNPLFALF